MGRAVLVTRLAIYAYGTVAIIAAIKMDWLVYALALVGVLLAIREYLREESE